MTTRYEGPIAVEIDESKKVVITLPGNKTVPEKRLWNNYAVWEHNGSRLTPLTQKAEESLVAAVAKLNAAGITKCHKDGSRKSASLRYGIITTGVEEFNYL